MTANHGYQVLLHELSAQVTALAALGDQTTGLVTSANRLAQRQPLLGTAPPALHLAARLREAAGEAGLAGEIGAADNALTGCHRALQETVAGYLHTEDTIAHTLRSAGDDS